MIILCVCTGSYSGVAKTGVGDGQASHALTNGSCKCRPVCSAQPTAQRTGSKSRSAGHCGLCHMAPVSGLSDAATCQDGTLWSQPAWLFGRYAGWSRVAIFLLLLLGCLRTYAWHQRSYVSMLQTLVGLEQMCQRQRLQAGSAMLWPEKISLASGHLVKGCHLTCYLVLCT